MPELKSRKVTTRRRFLKSTAAALTFSGFKLNIAQAQSKELVICTFGGQTFQAHRKAYFEPFEKETGIKIIDASPTDFAKLKAMVTSGNPEWDLVDAGNRHMFAGEKEGLLDPIDYKVIDASNILETAIHPFGIGSFFFSTNICGSAGVKMPTSWAEYYDVKALPGTRSMRNSSFENMEFALMATGVPASQVYPLTEEKIKAAYAKLDTLKPHVLKWWKIEAQVVQMLTDGETNYGMGPAGRLAVVKQQGAKVQWEWNQGNVNGDSWIIPKGARNKANAITFLRWFTTNPKQQAEFARNIPYGPVDKRAFQYLSADEAARLCTAPQNITRQLINDGKWWGENFERMEQRWNAWILS